MLDHDEQLLESVAVRRHRLSLALLFGQERRHRSFSDGLKHAVIGLIVAALICAGCVGFSFIVSLFDQEKKRDRPAQDLPIAQAIMTKGQ